MNDQNNKNRGIATIMTTGLILICVPLSSVLIMLIFSLFRSIEKAAGTGLGSIEIHSGIPAGAFFLIAGGIFLIGLGMTGYVTLKKHLLSGRKGRDQ